MGSLFVCDTFSFLLSSLSIWVVFMSILASIKIEGGGTKGFYFLFVALLFFLVVSFSLDSLIGFYIFFEAVLIPMSLILFLWGGQPEKLQAGGYMLLYTLFGSLPLIIVLLGEEGVKVLSWSYLGFVYLEEPRIFVAGLTVLAFLVRAPMYLAHL